MGLGLGLLQLFFALSCELAFNAAAGPRSLGEAELRLEPAEAAAAPPPRAAFSVLNIYRDNKSSSFPCRLKRLAQAVEGIVMTEAAGGGRRLWRGSGLQTARGATRGEGGGRARALFIERGR